MGESNFRLELRRRMQSRTRGEEGVLSFLAGVAGVSGALLVTSILFALGLRALLGPIIAILGILLCVFCGVGAFTLTRIWLRAGRLSPQGALPAEPIFSPNPADWPGSTA